MGKYTIGVHFRDAPLEHPERKLAGGCQPLRIALRRRHARNLAHLRVAKRSVDECRLDPWQSSQRSADAHALADTPHLIPKQRRASW